MLLMQPTSRVITGLWRMSTTWMFQYTQQKLLICVYTYLDAYKYIFRFLICLLSDVDSYIRMDTVGVFSTISFFCLVWEIYTTKLPNMLVATPDENISECDTVTKYLRIFCTPTCADTNTSLSSPTGYNYIVTHSELTAISTAVPY